MLLLLFLVSLFSFGIDAQAACSSYWQYVKRASQIEGLLTLTLNNAYSEHTVKITLSVGTQLPSSYVGEISLIKNANDALRDVKNGYSIQYRVVFPVQSPLPKLTEVFYNDRRLCTGPKDTGTYITTINLDHFLYTVVTFTNQQQQQPAPIQNYHNFQLPEEHYHLQVQYTQPTSPPPTVWQAPATTTRPKIQNTQAPQIPYRLNTDSDNQCGVPFAKFDEVTGLVINGRTAKKGQFPWLAVYHHNGNKESGFICGGSLVSSKAIITAAHCIHEKDIFEKKTSKKKASEGLFYLGKYDLSDVNEKNYLISPVEEFIIHPDWNPYSESFDADIAIAKLVRVVPYTEYIRPICLWQSTNSYNDIVKKLGVVAGYGKTMHNIQAVSSTPMWAPLSVVDEVTCLRSNSAFMKITTNRTFCAGDRNGQGPCNGDSGGGFVVNNNGKYYLRGIVSSSIFDSNTYSCDVNNYAVFTDVAVFTSWIQRNM